MRRQDLITSEMGRLMLQRWTMLGEACPVCLTPIMRSPSHVEPAEFQCIGCSKKAGSLDDFFPKPEVATPAVARSAAAPAAAAALPLPSAVMGAARPVAVSPAAAVSAATATAVVAPALSGASATIVHAATTALWAKLDACRMELSATTDVSRLLQLSELLGSLARSLHACQQLQ